jgi:hypothetical protein
MNQYRLIPDYLEEASLDRSFLASLQKSIIIYYQLNDHLPLLTPPHTMHLLILFCLIYLLTLIYFPCPPSDPSL